jgi:cytochrome b pre-mRNA-processing protein 3
MGFFSKIFSRKSAAKVDAERIYDEMMTRSRQPEFYGHGRVSDNYDGRIDVLSLHLSVIIRALNTHGEQGKRLAQALYEVMRDDWDVALREEGMSDTGTMKRIKPMIRLFYTRLKAYTDGINAGDISTALREGVLAAGGESEEQGGSQKVGGDDSEFLEPLASYAMACASALDGKSLGEIALIEFTLPQPPKKR